ncbi:uncharacterized protein AKAME5_001981600 [Lates japonicus]|uniref:C-type lectin domain-containing protein n=1 Tax=Lates japonicus TaxID=270547 RepID=A0AAD3N8E7_LATJO|nr:uncharacterized protein AKAME5_001981600 [Lates japonicus]
MTQKDRENMSAKRDASVLTHHAPRPERLTSRRDVIQSIILVSDAERMMRTKICKDIYWILLQLWLHSVFSAASLPNVAPSGTASQSSTYDPVTTASKANDGSRVSTYADCTHTAMQTNPWWRLLLPGIYRITAVSVTNRVENPHRINNAEIRIGNSAENNSNNNPRCAVIPSIPAGQTATFQCGGMEGRFVNVYLPGANKVLTLCEVEVYGELVSHSRVVLGRNIMVVGKRLCWSDALFFCRDFFWDLLSLRSQEEQMELEQVLSNISFPLTKHLWLGLRRSLMGEEWFWMTGDSMNYNRLDTSSIWQNTSPCGGVDSSSPSLWTDLPCDEHLYFICLTDPQTDVNRVYFSSTRKSGCGRRAAERSFISAHFLILLNEPAAGSGSAPETRVRTGSDRTEQSRTEPNQAGARIRTRIDRQRQTGCFISSCRAERSLPHRGEDALRSSSFQDHLTQDQ